MDDSSSQRNLIAVSDGVLDIRFFVGQRLVDLQLDINHNDDVEKLLCQVFDRESILTDSRLMILSAVAQLLKQERYDCIEESTLGKTNCPNRVMPMNTKHSVPSFI
jgi:hypothetical protein